MGLILVEATFDIWNTDEISRGTIVLWDREPSRESSKATGLLSLVKLAEVAPSLACSYIIFDSELFPSYKNH